jgi:hypothetical protein
MRGHSPIRSFSRETVRAVSRHSFASRRCPSTETRGRAHVFPRESEFRHEKPSLGQNAAKGIAKEKPRRSGATLPEEAKDGVLASETPDRAG